MPRKVPTIDVNIERQIYLNKTKKYAFLLCSETRDPEKKILVHYCNQEGPDYWSINGRFRFYGKWNDDGTFKTKKCEPIRITRMEKLINFLSHAGIVGLTDERIASLCKAFGNDVLNKLGDEEALLVIPTVGPETAKKIAASWAEIRSFFEGVKQIETQLNKWISFQSFERFTPKHYYMAYKKYGPSMAETILENPYRLVTEFEYDFHEVDRICCHFPGINEKRNWGYALYYLSWKTNSGDCYTDYDEYYVSLGSIANASSFYEALSTPGMEFDLNKATQEFHQQLHDIEDSGDVAIIYDSENVPKYAGLGSISRKEDDIARALQKMSAVPSECWNIDMEQITLATGKYFDADQQEAIRTACASPVTLITGGAGTGKTQTIYGIITALEGNGKKVLLASPTAKAARNITGKTNNHKAETIHRMLLYDGIDFRVNEDNPLHGDALIIDEASMIDLNVMHALVKAMPGKMQLILVGDVNQLEPVDIGAPFRDMIESGLFSTVRLNTIHRQKAGSGIITCAANILAGEVPDFDNIPDCTFIPQDDIQKIRIEIINQIRLAKENGFHEKDIIVLSPIKDSMLGVNSLNSMIKYAFNASPLSGEKNIFGCNDFVIQNRNDPKLRVVNGDIGIVCSVNENGEVTVEFGEGDKRRQVQYNQDAMRNLSLANAITIHKAQGSEFKVVIIPMIEKYTGTRPDRNLMYTAMTRAKEKLILIGTLSELKQYAETSHHRFTLLKKKMISLMRSEK